MNKFLPCLMCLCSSLAVVAVVACGGTEGTAAETARTELVVADRPADPAISALLTAYPDFISAIKDNRICFVDGTTMLYDDGEDKDFAARLDGSDAQDMFFVAYNSKVLPPEYLADAGRSRCEELFKKMYGATAAQVEAKLVSVPWFGKNVRFTAVNGAADSLVKVAADIAANPRLLDWVDCSGTYYWRPVRGARRLSAHSYGIAIDIAVKNSDYWLWQNPKAAETDSIKYANRIPRELVEAFERHGFIWGGAWYHFDTMHFEFRPEILAYADYSSAMASSRSSKK